MPAPVKAERGSTKRRSYRFSHKVPVVLSSATPPEFYERCETTDVSSHGCQVVSPRKLTPGQTVRLQIPQRQQETEARVACVRPDHTATAWEIGLELVEPGNIWGLKFSPPLFHWPADLPLPPLQAGGSAPSESARAAVLEEPRPEKARLPQGRADVQTHLDELKRLQEQQGKEFEARIQQTLREATQQLTKNAQFAMDTVEASARELSEAARGELQAWLGQQRAEMDQQLRRLADASRSAAVQDAMGQLRQQAQQALAQELEQFRARLREAVLEDFHVRLREAMEASLKTLADRLGKGKLP